MKDKNSSYLKTIFTPGMRVDGMLAKDVDHMQKFIPFMIRKRTEAQIFLNLQIDLSNTLSYIDKNNLDTSKQKLSLFILLLTAMVRVGVQKPRMNRFIAGKRIYDRNELNIAFVVKKEISENGTEIIVKESFNKTDCLQDVAAVVNRLVFSARNKKQEVTEPFIKLFVKLPRIITTFFFAVLRLMDYFGLVPLSAMKNDPLYSSAFVANLGSIGLDSCFHHLYDMGTTSLFIVLGKVKEDLVNIAFTIDERIADGYYYAKALELFKHYMENPWELEKPYEGIEK